MKLLFDQNLSPSLPGRLAAVYPHSTHIRALGLASALDAEIWEMAKKSNFVLVSKDSDFQQRGLLFGHPPKFIWLRVGNCPVKLIEELLRKHAAAIHSFERDAEKSHLMLECNHR